MERQMEGMRRQVAREVAQLKKEQEEAPSKKPAPVSNQEIELGSLIS
jgi:hypothetical protein